MATIEHFLKFFKPEHYDLMFDITPGERDFTGQVIITGERLTSSSPIKLHAEDLTIESVLINQTTVDFRHNKDVLTITPAKSARNKLAITIKFAGQITDSMTGIYPSRYNLNEQTQTIISTQFESHYARQAFPCIDEPAAKAVFDLTIVTQSDLTVLANTPIAKQSTIRNRQTVTFEPTPKMSTYLLAFVIGQLISKTRLSESGIVTTVYATPAQSQTSLNFALDIASRAIDWFEDYLRVPYPLPKCDHVAIPDFAAGAMENWGLITYREALLLADDTTPITTKEQIATVITHELAHMWFGNLVTMKWWDELWLNESLASLMEYACLDALEPSLNVWETFYSYNYTTARQRDALPGVQPILMPINHPDEISTIFDGAIVYSKGAVVMRMLENLIGAANFRKALTSYLNKFAFKTASTEDFLRIFHNFSRYDVEQFMQTWLSKPGYPLVTVTAAGDKFELTQQQFGYQSTTKWPIPVTHQRPAEIWSKKKFSSTAPVIDPDIRNLMIVNYADSIAANVRASLIESGDPIASYDYLASQIMLVRQYLAPATSLLDNLLQFSDTSDQLVWQGLSRTLANLQLFVTDDETSLAKLRQIAAEAIKSPLAELSWVTQADDDINQLKLRPLLVGISIFSRQPDEIKQALRLFNQFGLAKLENLPANIRDQLIGVKIRHEGDLDLAEALLERYVSTNDPDLKDDLASGLTFSEDELVVRYLLDQLLKPEVIKPQDILTWYARLIANHTNRLLVWAWLQKNFKQLVKLFDKNKDYVDFIRISAGYLTTARELRQFDVFFKPYQNDRAAKRVITVGYREIQARHKLWLANHQAVREALINHQ